MRRIGFIVAWAAGILGMFAISACRDRNNSQARIAAYEENGVVWGWGEIRLATPATTTGIFLDRLPQPAPNGQIFKLVGADGANTTDVFYADWHPVLDPPVPVVFASQFFLQERAGARGGILDVYVKLKKPGRSWPEAYTLSVGTADISGRAVDRYPVSLADGLRLSRLVSGAQRGAVVFHYADLPRDVNDDADGAPAPARRLGAEGFNETTQGGQAVLALPAGSQGKLTFTSRSIKAKPADHPRLCQDQFFAGARSASNQVNKACKITLAPSDSTSNWLTCSLLVQFDNPVTVAEKTCRVIGSFLDENDPGDQLGATIIQTGTSSPGGSSGSSRGSSE